MDDNKRIYKCANCSKMRTKDEGGQVFVVCDECWDEHYRLKQTEDESDE